MCRVFLISFNFRFRFGWILWTEPQLHRHRRLILLFQVSPTASPTSLSQSLTCLVKRRGGGGQRCVWMAVWNDTWRVYSWRVLCGRPIPVEKSESWKNGLPHLSEGQRRETLFGIIYSSSNGRIFCCFCVFVFLFLFVVDRNAKRFLFDSCRHDHHRKQFVRGSHHPPRLFIVCVSFVPSPPVSSFSLVLIEITSCDAEFVPSETFMYYCCCCPPFTSFVASSRAPSHTHPTVSNYSRTSMGYAGLWVWLANNYWMNKKEGERGGNDWTAC